MREILQERESNLDFYLGGKCKFTCIQQSDKWANNLAEDELKKVGMGLKTIEEARLIVIKIYAKADEYRKQVQES